MDDARPHRGLGRMYHARTAAETGDDEGKKAGRCKNGCDLMRTQCPTYTTVRDVDTASRVART